jgi:gamma-glutamyl:cysteine ligase YbdK (ATP-grasp superfamily)
MDAVERVEDAVALAAYAQALVKRAVDAPQAPPPSALEDALVRENKWQAIRYGLDGAVIAADGRRCRSANTCRFSRQRGLAGDRESATPGHR